MKKDDWLSTVVSRDCYILLDSDVPTMVKSDFYTDAFYTCRTLATSSYQQDCLLKLGFRSILTEVEFCGDVSAEAQSSSTSRVRAAVRSDRDKVLKIASTSFRYDRFHTDSCISRQKADQIKEFWVASALDDESVKDVWVAEYGREIAGFCLTMQSSGAVRIDLIAVASEFRGLGIGTSLVTALPSCLDQETVRIVAGTQQRNSESCRLYKKLGMTITLSRDVYHSGFF